MRLLLGSGGIGTPERKAAWLSEFDAFLGPARRVTFLPYAGGDHDFYVKRMLEAGFVPGRSLEGLHRAKDPVAAIRKAEAIYVGGGNSFRLLHDLYHLKLLGPIRERVARGVPYVGISAGSNMACPTMKTTNDMPIIAPPKLDALGLVPFQINPHYFAGAVHYAQGNGFIRYGGETRDDRLREFHEMNATPVLGLYEGSMVRVEGKKATLKGIGGARLFLKGKKPRDLKSGASVSFLLK